MKMVWIFSDSSWILPFLMALSTAFIIDRSLSNGIISGKYFWFYGSIGLVAIATVLGLWFKASCLRFKVSTTDGFVLLFAGSVFLSSLVFNDASGNTTKLTLLALLVVLYFCLRINTLFDINQNTRNPLLFSPKKDKLSTLNFQLSTLICVFIILTGLIEAVWGLLQLYGFKPSQHGLFRLTGSFFNPGPYAGYLAVVFPLALHEALKRVNFKHRATKGTKFHRVLSSIPNSSFLILNSLACIAILLVLPAAMSRAAWLATIAGSAVVLIRNYELGIRNYFAQQQSRVTRHVSLFAIVIVTATLLTGAYHLKKNSADGRLLTWKVSLSVVAKHPLGVGLGNFPGAYGDAQAAYFASGNASETEEYVAGNPEYGFNEFLQIAIESGVVSLLLFIGMIVCAFRGLIKSENWGVMGSLVALLVFACFSYPFSVLPFLIVFVFLLAMSDGTRMKTHCHPALDAGSPEKTTGLRVKPAMTGFIRLICVICVLLITTFCLRKQYPVYGAYKQWNRDRVYYQMGMYKETAEKYEPLYPYLNDQIQFLFEYGRSLSQSVINDSQGMADQVRHDSLTKGMTDQVRHDSLTKGMADQVRHDRLNKSNEVLQRATKISCDPMLYNIMGKNYQAMQEYELAEASLLKSTYIVPNRLYPWYLLMKLYIETGDEEKAIEAAGIVLTKEPKVQSTAVREMREEARKELRVKN